MTVPAVAFQALVALPADKLRSEVACSTFRPISPGALSNGVHRVEPALRPVLIFFRFRNRRARASRRSPLGQRARLIEVRLVEESNEATNSPSRLIRRKTPRRIVGRFVVLIIPQQMAIPRESPVRVIRDDLLGSFGQARWFLRPCLRSYPLRARRQHSFTNSFR